MFLQTSFYLIYMILVCFRDYETIKFILKQLCMDYLGSKILHYFGSIFIYSFALFFFTITRDHYRYDTRRPLCANMPLNNFFVIHSAEQDIVTPTA